MPRADEKFDIVFFWKQNDTGIYGRRQDMLVKYLAKDPRIARIFHFDAPIRLLAAGNLAWQSSRNAGYSQAILTLRQTLRRKLGLENRGKVRCDTFIYFTRKRMGGFLKPFWPAGEAYAEYVQRKLRRQGVGRRRTLLWVCPNDFYFPSLRERIDPDLVIADVIDDQRAWPCTPEHKAALSANYAEILGQSDLVFANCRTVVASMGPFASEICLVPNAAENLWERARNWPRPPAMRRIRGSVVGYAGNLDTARIDLELLKQVATERPDWSLVFLGSTHKNRELLTLKKFRNVHFLGVRPHDEAIRIIRHFDVAILPHQDNELTRHMNPLKMYVYFSMNVPVVTTPIADVEEFDWFAHVAASPEAFIDRIAHCLCEDTVSAKAGLMRDWLEANCWERRVNDILALVESKFANGGG